MLYLSSMNSYDRQNRFTLIKYTNVNRKDAKSLFYNKFAFIEKNYIGFSIN